MTEKSKKQTEKEEELARATWDSWIEDLEDKEQPESCSIDGEDCEACGS
tara:strand:- start:28 stop:174 length:147 start_codon:yes stop_codon:yes gene_type:complete